VDRRNRQQRLKAGRDALPANDETTLLLLKPGTRALGLEPRHHFFERSATVFLGLPDPLRDLRPDPALPSLLPEGFRLIAFLRRDPLEACARATPFARADLDGIEPWHHLGTLLPLGWRGPVRQGQAAPCCEAMHQAPLAFPPVSDARATPLPRGNKRHTPSASCLVLLQSRWCPSIACIKEQRNDVDRSQVELGVKVAWHVIAQRGFHGPRLVHHTCRHRWAIQPLTGMRLRDSNDLRPGRTAREAMAALRHTGRRPPSPDDWGRWRTPSRTPEVDRVPCLGRAQQACARCAYFIPAIEGHHHFLQTRQIVNRNSSQKALS